MNHIKLYSCATGNQKQKNDTFSINTYYLSETIEKYILTVDIQMQITHYLLEAILLKEYAT